MRAARGEASRRAPTASTAAGCRRDGIETVVDDPSLGWHELADLDGVITGCELGIAVTGTVALATGPAQGRRAATLLPDLHVCVVRGEQIVETVPEAMARLAAPIAARRAITFISGPSATSDIELKRVEGVHGPRRLELIVAASALRSRRPSRAGGRPSCVPGREGFAGNVTGLHQADDVSALEHTRVGLSARTSREEPGVADPHQAGHAWSK